MNNGFRVSCIRERQCGQLKNSACQCVVQEASDTPDASRRGQLVCLRKPRDTQANIRIVLLPRQELIGITQSVIMKGRIGLLCFYSTTSLYNATFPQIGSEPMNSLGPSKQDFEWEQSAENGLHSKALPPFLGLSCWPQPKTLRIARDGPLKGADTFSFEDD